ncbi:hypothetical protein HMPREF1502_1913 [Klebsiella sp. AS10]|nr:hypothetical protein HMPREF1502_1913 [Klebsiella sp. AS10]
MTSKLTREERIQSLYDLKIGQVLNQSDIESIKMLARIALAAMDSSESVELPLDYLQGHKDGLEWAAQLAEANHPETGDWLYDDPIELAKAIRKGPDMPPAQPVADSEPVAWTWNYREQWHVTNDERRAEFVAKDGDVAVLPLYRHAQPAPEYPEVLPCSVLLEPGLRFGKGIKTSTMLAALARRAVHESDLAALSPEERAEFQARIEDFKALIAQPAPLVPEVDADDNFYSWFGREWAENYQHNQYTTAAKQMLGVMAESAWIAATERQRQKQSVSVPDVKIYEDVPYGVGRFKTHRDCYCDGWNACRAAMLNHPSSIQPNTDAATGTEIKHPSSNSPVIPEGCVMVPKEPTPEMLEVINEAIKSMRGSAATYARVLAAAPQEVK